MNWVLFQNSLLVAGGASLLAAGFGLATALWASGLGPGWRTGVIVLGIVAFALPPFLVVNCWLNLLGQTGLWKRWLPLDIYSLGGTVWTLALMLWPVSFFLTLAAWAQLPPSQIESDGALHGFALLRWVLFPTAQPALVPAALITVVLALGNFTVPALLQVKVFPAELWVRFSTDFDYPGAALLSLPLVVPPIFLLCWLRQRPVGWPRLEAALPAPILRRCLGPWWWAAAALAGFVVLAAAGLPLLDLANSRRTWSELPGAAAAGLGAMGASLRLAGVTATLVVAVGWAAWRWRAGFALWGFWLVPGVLLGIACIFVFNRRPFAAFYQSSGVILLALLLRYLAIGWQGANWARRSLDRDLDDLARLNGATPWQRLRWVHWPQLAPQFMATWYIVYLLVLWDVETILLIMPPGGETLAVRIFNLLHYGHNAQVDALCLILLGLALAPGGVWLAARACRADRRIPVGAALLLAAGAGGGCAPSPSGPTELPSAFFSRVEVWGTRGAGPGQFNKPRSVAVDRADNVYVVDITGRVQKFSPEGVWLLSWQMPQTDLGKPKGMGLDRQGRIVVIEPHYSRVNHFSVDGRLEQQWGEHGTNAGQLAFPRAVAVSAQDELFVSEYGVVDRVQRFTADGRRLLSVFGRYGSGPGEFNRPEGLALDARNRLFVADSCNHRVQILDEGGRWLGAFGRAGSGLGELSYPYDVAIDARGNRFVCEFGNSRIQVFDPENRGREIIGRAGSAPGEFNNPWSIALDSRGNLYVADAGNHRVQKLVRRPADS